MKRYPAILSRLYNTPHCIIPGKLEEIAAFLEAVQHGQTREKVEVEPPQGYCLTPAGEQVALSSISAAERNGDAFVAVLPLFGTMFQHGSMEMEFSGGTSTEEFGRQFSRLVDNPSIKTIIIETHSPGGQVFGTGELSDLIFAARKSGTRVVSVVNSEMASAALWAGTAAHEVVITPGGWAGSVGAVMIHQDFSKSEEQEGVKTTLIASPAKKVAGHPFAPLDKDTHAELLAQVEKTVDRFVSALSRNRGVSEAKVRSNFGGGGMLRADEAVAAGMADRIGTFRDVLAAEVKALQKPAPRGGSKASNERGLQLAEAETQGVLAELT